MSQRSIFGGKAVSESTTQPAVSLPAELDERERQLRDDYDWARGDQRVREQYAGLFVAVHRKAVLGSGQTPGDAVREALTKPDCPARQALAKVYVEA
jgi:hypothetical protein